VGTVAGLDVVVTDPIVVDALDVGVALDKGSSEQADRNPITSAAKTNHQRKSNSVIV
jgi:hypothetical protein